jgi:hypothetical protein
MIKKITLLILLCSPIINAQNWGEQILNHPNVAVGLQFGFSVAIDGDYAVVGSPMDNDQTGSASIYKKDVNGVWNHHQKLEAYVGKHANEFFGWVVAIQGDFVFVSALTDRLNEQLFQIPTGSVMIYKKDANNVWTGIQRLRASDPGHADSFGSDIAVEGNNLIIGARSQGYDANGENFMWGSGAVYIFSFDERNTVWNQTQKITSPDRVSYDVFGQSLSISGDYLAIGSKNDTDVNDANPVGGNGSVFVFKKDNGVWTEVQKLKPSISVNSKFGWGDVSISGDYIAVGAKDLDFFDNNQYYYGLVFMFKKDENGVWQESQIIKTDFPAENFGTNLSLDKNLLLVSAPESSVRNNNNSNISGVGLSYLFVKNTQNQFVLSETIKASEVIVNSKIGGGTANGEEGFSGVAIKDNQFIIGAPNSKRPGNVNLTGVAYISGDLDTFVPQYINWTGNLDSNWGEPQNWDINRLPNPIDNVTIPDVVNAPIVQPGQKPVINDLHNLDIVTIDTYASLTINGNLNQENTIQINTIEEISSSLILLGNQTNNTPPNTIYNRSVTGNKLHLIASPLINVAIDDFVLNSPLAIDPNNANNLGLAFYNNNNSVLDFYQAGSVGSGNFINGKGYGVLTSENTILNFTGKLKDTNLENYPIVENTNGWNLIGNPYPAFLNANSDANATENILTENIDNLDPVAANIYLWNPNTNTYNPIGNGQFAAYISPGQAFFVKSKIGGGVININKTFQTHRGEVLFFKNEASNKIILELTDNTLIANTTIAFNETMTNGLDVSFDAAVFDGLPNTFSLYTQLKESHSETPFAIQYLPEINDNTTSVNVGVFHDQEKELSLQLKEINLDPNKFVYLEDKVTNIFTNLKENNVYTFTHTPANNGVNRFEIHIQSSALSIQNLATLHLNIYKKDANTLQINGLVDESQLSIFDMNGKTILQNKKVSPTESSVSIPKVSSGLYIIKIIDKNGKQLTKKMIF